MNVSRVTIHHDFVTFTILWPADRFDWEIFSAQILPLNDRPFLAILTQGMRQLAGMTKYTDAAPFAFRGEPEHHGEPLQT